MKIRGARSTSRLCIRKVNCAGCPAELNIETAVFDGHGCHFCGLCVRTETWRDE